MSYTQGQGAVIAVSVDGATASRRDVESVADALRRLDESNFQKLIGQFGALRSTVESATVKLGSLESNMAKVQAGAISLAKGLLVGAAAGMSIGAITDKVMGVVDSMAKLKEVSEKTGSSVENLSKLNFVAKQSGSDIESVAAALGKMSKGMAGADNETKGAGLALKFLGIAAKDAAGNLKDPAAMFTEVAKKLDVYQDGAGKAAIAQSLFGKAGADMLPTLKLLAEQGDLAAKVTDAQATAARLYTRDIAKLDAQKGMLFKTLAVALLPTMTDFANAMLDASKNTKTAGKSIKGLADDNSIGSWADSGAMGLARLVDVIIFIPKALSAVSSSFKVVAADLAVLGNAAILSSPGNIAASLAHGENPWGNLKKSLAEEQEILKEANAKYSDLWNYQGDAMEKAMAKRIEARNAWRTDTTEDSSMATPWVRPKEALNYDTSGEDGDTKKTVAIDKEANAYATLIAAIQTKTAENKLETLTGENASESQKNQIKLEQGLASGKLTTASALYEVAKASLVEQAASEQSLKLQLAQKDVTKYIVASTLARNDSATALSVEYTMYGKSADARDIAMVAVKAEADTEKKLNDLREAKMPITDQILAQLGAEERARILVGQATIGQSKALAYASQLADENRRFAAESIPDERARVAALLEIDANKWRERIKLAGDGTEAQKTLATEYDTWYQNQLLKPQLDAERKMWSSIEQAAHDTFLSFGDGAKSAAQRAKDALKNGLFDWLYQMTAKKWIFNIAASVGMTGATGMAQAANAAGGIGNSVSALSGLSGALNFGGSAIAGVGNFVGSSSMSAFGAGFAGNSAGMVTTAAETFANAGMAMESSAASLGATFAAAAPYLATAMAVYAIWKSQDTSGTYHTGGASSASAAGVTSVRAESLHFEATQVNAETEKMTAALASGIVNILDSTASAFGKTAGYTAATAFADDTSKDGAWGGLVISKLGEKILDWQDTKTGSWAPKVFADGEAGKAEYLTALSASVRTALDGIGLPAWAQTMLDKVGSGASLDELGKVVDSINATERALTAMGDKLTGFASMSEGAVSALIAASGGIDALASSASSYYDNFYSDAEKTAGSVKMVSDALAAVGLAMPASREAYRAQVEAQMALGESAASTVAVLLKNSAAFAQLSPVMDAVATSTQSAADALVAADEIRKEQRGLDIQLMTAMGDAEGALAATRKDALTALLSDQARLTQQQIWAATDTATAIAKAQESSKAQADAAQSAYQAFGNSIVSSMKSATAAAQALRDFNKALLLGASSPLDAKAKYAIAKQGFESASPDDLQSAATAFLDASKAKGGSALNYARDFAAVFSRIEQGAAARDSQAAALPEFWKSLVDSGTIGAHAKGGVASGWSIVGENGPELANFTDPARIYPAEQTRQLFGVAGSRLSSGGNGGGVGGGGSEAAIREEVRALRADLNAALREISGNTSRGARHAKDTADTLGRVTRGGQYLMTSP